MVLTLKSTVVSGVKSKDVDISRGALVSEIVKHLASCDVGSATRFTLPDCLSSSAQTAWRIKAEASGLGIIVDTLTRGNLITIIVTKKEDL